MVGWNVQLIHSSFGSGEADAILSLPLGSSQVEDSLQWHYDKFRVYSVRNGYKLGRVLSS